VINNIEIAIFDKTQHKTKNFNCGNEALNLFLQQFAAKQQKKWVGRTFVAINNDHHILGFYTLSAGSVQHQDAPEHLRKGLPKYPIPTATLGRLAVHEQYQGKGLGHLLLKDALIRILFAAQELGIVAIIVDAKDKKSAEFYKNYGLIEFPDKPLKLFMQLETIAMAYK